MGKTRAALDIHPKVQASAIAGGGAYLAVVAAIAALSAIRQEKKGKLPPAVAMALSGVAALLPIVAGYLKGEE